MDVITTARYKYIAVVSTLRITRILNTASPNEGGKELISCAYGLLTKNERLGRPYTFLYGDSRFSIVLDGKESEHVFPSQAQSAIDHAKTAR